MNIYGLLEPNYFELIVWSSDISNLFLRHYNKTISDLISLAIRTIEYTF